MASLRNSYGVGLQEEQERIRKRIREDIKDSVTAHTDYAENVLPRLKRAYIRKCQEAEVSSHPFAAAQGGSGRRAIPAQLCVSAAHARPCARTGVQVCSGCSAPLAHLLA